MQSPQQIERSRLACLAAVVIVIALGLASRALLWLFPAALGKYPGDALWALMVFAGWAMMFPRRSTPALAGIALASSFAVEFSQLYKTPWLDVIRGNFFGHLALGSGFARADLPAYSIGIAAGFACDGLMLRNRAGPSPAASL